MWNRLGQIAQSVQGSLQSGDEDMAGAGGSPTKNSIANLEEQLIQSENRNKMINEEFKRLLKERQREIDDLKQRLKEDGHDLEDSIANKDTSSILNDSALSRKVEEYEMLLQQKDDSLQLLTSELHEVENHKSMIEEQERKNTEKLMHELAGRIKAHETISRKLEEMKHLLEEKDTAVRNMADQMGAQEELIRAKDESIKKLKRMAAGSEATEDMIVTLQKSIQDKDAKASAMLEKIDKLETENKILSSKVSNRDELGSSKDETIDGLYSEIHQKGELLRKTMEEKRDVDAKLIEKEDELRKAQKHLELKESELGDMDTNLRKYEEEIQALKANIQSLTDEHTKTVSELRDRLTESSELLRSKSETLNVLQNVDKEKEGQITELNGKVTELTHQVDSVGSTLTQELESEVSKREAAQRLLDELQETNKSLSQEKDSLEDQLQNCGKLLSETKDQLNESITKLSERETNLSENISEFSEIRKELDKVKEICKQLEDKNAEYESSNSELAHSLLATRSEVENQNRENIELVQKIRTLELRNNDLSSSSQREVERLQEKISEMETAGDDLREQLQKLEHENFVCMEENVKHEQRLIALGNELKLKTEEEEGVRTKLEVASLENSQLTERLNALEEGVAKQQDGVSTLTSELKAKCEELVAYQQNLNTIASENTDMQDSLKNLEQENNSLNERNSKQEENITNLKNELQTKCEDILKLEEVVKEATKEREASKQGLKKLEVENNTLAELKLKQEENIASLNHNLESKHKENIDLEERLTNLSQENNAVKEMMHQLEQNCNALNELKSKQEETLLQFTSDLNMKCEELERVENKLIELDKDNTEFVNTVKKKEQDIGMLNEDMLKLQNANQFLNSCVESKDLELDEVKKLVGNQEDALNKLKAINDELGNENKEFRESNTRLKEKVKHLNSSCKELKKANKKWENELTSMEKEKQSLSNVVKEKDIEISRLQESVSDIIARAEMSDSEKGSILIEKEKLSLEISELKQDIASLNESLSKKDREIEVFKVNAEQSERDMNDMKSLVASKETELSSALTCSQEHEEACREVGSRLHDREQELEASKRVVTELEGKKVVLENELAEMKQTHTTAVSQMEEKEGAMKNRIRELDVKCDEIGKDRDESQMRNTALQEELNKVRLETDELRSQNASLLEEKKGKDVEINRLQESVSDIIAKAEMSDSEKGSVLIEKEKLSLEISELKQDIGSLNEALSTKDREIEVLRVNAEQSEKDMNDMKSLVASKETELSSALKCSQEHEEACREVGSRLHDKEQELEASKRVVTELEDIKAMLQNELAEMKQTHMTAVSQLEEKESAMKNRIRELDAKCDEIGRDRDESQMRNAALQEELNKVVLEIDELRSQNASLLEEKKETELTREQMNSERSDIEARMKELSDNFNTTENRYSESAEQIQILENKNRELENCVDALHKEKDNLESNIEELRQSKKDVEKAVEDLADKNKVLTNTVADMDKAFQEFVSKAGDMEGTLNASVQEKLALEENLRQEEHRRSEIEQALEEFVKMTESRKKKSGRASGEEMDSAPVMIPEGTAGYNSPSPRRQSPSGYPLSPSQSFWGSSENIAGGFFEGKTFSEIFQLVEEERCSLERKLDNSIREQSDLGKQLEQAESLLQLEREKLKQVKEQYSQLQQFHDLKKREQEDLIESYEVDIKHTRQYVEDLEQQKSKLENEARDSELQLIQLQQDLTQKTEEATNAAQSFHSDIQILTSARDEALSEINSKEAEIVNLRTEISTLNENLLSKSNEVNKVSESLKAKDEELQKAVNRQEQDMTKARKVMKKMKTAISEKEKEVQDQAKELGEVKAILALKDSDIESLNAQLRELKAVTEEKSSRLEEAQLSLGNKEDEISRLREEFSARENERETLISEHAMDIEGLRNSISVLEEQLSGISQEKVAIEQKLTKVSEDLVNERNNYEDKVKELERSLMSKDEDSIQLVEIKEQEISRIKADCQKLNRTLEEKDGEIEALKESVSCAVNEIQRKTEETESLNTSLNDARGELASVKDALNSTETQLVEAHNTSQNISGVLESTEVALQTHQEKEEYLETELSNKLEYIKQCEDSISNQGNKLLESESLIRSLQEEKEQDKQTNAQLHEFLDAAREKEQRFKEIISSMEEDLQCKDDEVNKLKNDLSMLTEDAETKGDIIGSLQQSIMGKEEQVVSLQKCIDEHKEQLNQLSESNDGLRNQNQFLQSEAGLLKESLQASAEQIRELVDRLGNKEEELDRTTGNLQAKESEIEKLTESYKTKISDVTNELIEKQKELDEKAEELSQKEQTIDSLRAEGENVVSVLKEKSEMVVGEKASEIQRLEDMVCKLQLEIQSLLNNNVALGEEKAGVKAQLTEELGARNALQEEVETLQGQIQIYQETILSLQNQETSLSTENQTLISRNNEFEDRIRGLEGKLQEQVVIAQEKDNMLKDLRSATEQRDTGTAELMEKIRVSQEMIDRLEESLRLKEKELTDKSDEVESLVNDIGQMRVALETKEAALAASFGEVKTLRGKNSQYCEENEQIKEEIATLTQEKLLLLQDLEGKISSLSELQALVEKEKEERESHVNGLEAEKENLKACVSELSSNVEVVQGQLTDMDQKLKDAAQELAVAKEENSSLKEEVANKQEELDSLKSSFNTFKAKTKRKLKSLGEELTAEKRSLSDKAQSEEGSRIQVTELESRNESLLNDVNKLEKEKSVLENSLDEKAVILKAKEDMILSLTAAMDAQENKVNENAAALSAALESNEQKVVTLQQELLTKEEELLKFNNENKELIQSLETKLSALELSLNTSRRETQTAFEERDALGNEKEELLAELGRANSLVRELSVSCSDIDQLRNALNNSTRSLEKSREENEDLKNKLSKVVKKAQAMKKELAEKQRVIGELSESNLKKAASENVDLTSIVDNAEMIKPAVEVELYASKSISPDGQADNLQSVEKEQNGHDDQSIKDVLVEKDMQIKNFEEVVSEKVQLVTEKENYILELQSALDELKSQSGSIAPEMLLEKESKIKNLEEAMVEKEQLAVDKENYIQELHNVIDELKSQGGSVEPEILIDKEMKIKKLEEAMLEKDQLAVEKENYIHELQNAVDQLKSQSGNVEPEMLIEKETKIKSLEEIIVEKDQLAVEKERRLLELQSVVDELRLQRGNLEQTDSSHDAVDGKGCEDTKGREKQIDMELESLQKKCKRQAENLEKLKKKITLMRKEEAKVNKENKELRSEMSKLKQSNEELNLIIRKLNEEIDDHQKSQSHLNNKNSEMKDLIDSLERERELLDKELKGISKEIEEVRQMKEGLLEDLDSHKQRLEILNSEYSKEKHISGKLAHENEKLIDVVMDLGEERTSLKNEVEKMAVDLQCKEEEFSSIHDELNQVRCEVRQKDQVLAEFERQLKDLKDEKCDVDEERSQLFSNLEQLREENRVLELERDHQITEIAELKENLWNLEEEKRKVEEERGEDEMKLKELQQELSQLGEEKRALEDQLAGVQNAADKSTGTSLGAMTGSGDHCPTDTATAPSNSEVLPADSQDISVLNTSGFSQAVEDETVADVKRHKDAVISKLKAKLRQSLKANQSLKDQLQALTNTAQAEKEELLHALDDAKEQLSVNQQQSVVDMHDASCLTEIDVFSEITTLKEELAEAAIRYDKLKAFADETIGGKELAEQSVVELSAQILALQTDSVSMQKNIELERESISNELYSLKSQLHEKELEIGTLMTTIEKHENERNEKDASISQIEEEIKVYQQKLLQHEKRHAVQDAELDRNLNLIRDLTSQMENARNEAISLASELSQEKRNAANAREELLNVIEEKESNCLQLENVVAELETSLHSSELNASSRDEEYGVLAARLEETLKDKERIEIELHNMKASVDVGRPLAEENFVAVKDVRVPEERGRVKEELVQAVDVAVVETERKGWQPEPVVVEEESDVQKMQDELESVKKHKDSVILKLKHKMKQVLKEKEALKEKHEQEKKSYEGKLANDRAEYELNINETRKQCEVLSQNVRETEKLLEERNSQLSKLENLMKEQETHLEDKDRQIVELSGRETQLQTSLKQSEHSNRKLEDEKNSLEELRSILEETIQVNENRLASLQQSLQNLTTDLENTKASLTNASQEKEALSSSVESIKEEADMLRETVDSLQREKSDVEHRLNEEQAQLKRLLENTESESAGLISQLKEDLEKERGSSADAVSTLNSEKDRNSKLNGELDMALAEKEALAVGNQGLSQNLSVALDTLERVAALFGLSDSTKVVEAVKWCQERQTKFEQDSKRFQVELSTLQEQQTDMELKCASLETALAESSSEYEKKIKGMAVAIQEADEYLRSVENELVSTREMLVTKEEELLVVQKSREGQDMRLNLLMEELVLKEDELKERRIQLDYEKSRGQLLLQEIESLKNVAVPQMESRISEKNQSFLSLRTEFEAIMTEKEAIIESLRVKNSSLRTEKEAVKQSLVDKEELLEKEVVEKENEILLKNAEILEKEKLISEKERHILEKEREVLEKEKMLTESEEGIPKKEMEMAELRTNVSAKDAEIQRLQGTLTKLQGQLASVTSELDIVAKEKDKIGGSYRSHFYDISHGLREDVELAFKEKKEVEVSFDLERLNLERQREEKIQELKKMKAKISEYINDVNQKNDVISELQDKLERISSIAAKEEHYLSLEHRLEVATYEKSKLGSKLEAAQDSIIQKQATIDELKLQYDNMVAEKESLVLDFESRLQNNIAENTDYSQRLRNEFEAWRREKDATVSKLSKQVEELENQIVATKNTHNEELNRVKDNFEERIKTIRDSVNKLEAEKLQLRQDLIQEISSSHEDAALQLRDEYLQIIEEKDDKIDDLYEQFTETQQYLYSAQDENVELREELQALELERKKALLLIDAANRDREQLLLKQTKEIGDLLRSKGKEFRELREQFEEAMRSKDDVIENQRKILRDARDEKEELELEVTRVKSLYDASTKKMMVVSSESESLRLSLGNADNRIVTLVEELKLKEEEIDLLAVNKDELDKEVEFYKSLLQEMRLEIDRLQNALVKEEKTPSDLDMAEVRDEGVSNGSEKEESDQITSEIALKQLEIGETKISDQGMGSSNVLNGVKELPKEEEVVKEEASFVEEGTAVGNVDSASDIVQKIKSYAFDLPPELENSDADDVKLVLRHLQNVLKEPLHEDTENNHKAPNDKHLIGETMNPEQGKILRKRDIEENVRRQYEDIMKNLREDIQNAINENQRLQAELFDFKQLKPELPLQQTVYCTTGCQTDTQISVVRPGDVSFETNEEPSNLGNDLIPDNNPRTTAGYLPELVAETLQRPVSIEPLQATSNSTVVDNHLSSTVVTRAETQNHVNVLETEIAALKAKVEESTKTIAKLKHISKHYKVEAINVRTQKEQEIDGLKASILSLQHEIEVFIKEKGKIDQELLSLREEVTVLVQEKASLVKSHKNEVGNVKEEEKKRYSSTINDLTSKLAEKETSIEELNSANNALDAEGQGLMSSLKNFQDEVKQLKGANKQLEQSMEEHRRRSNELQNSLEKEQSSLQKQKSTIRDLEAYIEDVQKKLLPKVVQDASTDNACFDMGDLKHRDNLISEKQNRIKDLEKKMILLVEEKGADELHYQSEIKSYQEAVASLQERVQRASQEKVQTEKMMQELRGDMERLCSDKDDMALVWKEQMQNLRSEKEMVRERLEAEYRDGLSQRENELWEAKVQMEGMFSEQHGLKEELSLVKEQLNSLQEQNSKLQEINAEAMTELQRTIGEKKEAENLVSNLHQHITTLQKMAEDTNVERGQEVERYQEEIRRLNTIIDDVNERVVQKDNEYQQLEADNQRKRESVRKLKKEVLTLKNEKQQLESDINGEYHAYVDQVQNENESLRTLKIEKDRELQECRMHLEQSVMEKSYLQQLIRNSGKVELETMSASAITDVISESSRPELLRLDYENNTYEERKAANSPEEEQLRFQLTKLQSESKNNESIFEDSLMQVRMELQETFEAKNRAERELTHLRGLLKYRTQPKRADKINPDVTRLKDTVSTMKSDLALLRNDASLMCQSFQQALLETRTNAVQLLQSPVLPASGDIQKTLLDVTDYRPVDDVPDLSFVDNSTRTTSHEHQKIEELEGALSMWQSRCAELEDQLQRLKPSDWRQDATEEDSFLIDMDEISGQGQESAIKGPPGYMKRLVEYSTSGIKSSPRFRLPFFHGRRGVRSFPPLRRSATMIYVVLLHAMALWAIYCAFKS